MRAALLCLVVLCAVVTHAQGGGIFHIHFENAGGELFLKVNPADLVCVRKFVFHPVLLVPW